MGTLTPHDVRELRALVAKLKQTAADLDTLSKDLENICRIATETAANFKAVSSAPYNAVATRRLARRLAALKSR